MTHRNETIASDLASKFANIYYNFDPESISKTPENQFLRDYGFMDEFGNYLKDGVIVDANGKPLEEEKEVEFKPFIMSDGSEAKKVAPKEVEEPKKKTRKSRTKKEDTEIPTTD